ncbi:MAG: hypothetical protein CMI30_01245 [Opitutae bacterium]|nr:hypothetical protein [Opitutae bacterium]
MTRFRKELGKDDFKLFGRAVVVTISRSPAAGRVAGTRPRPPAVAVDSCLVLALHGLTLHLR